MLQRIRDQIGTASLIVAIVALVVALAGGAYAASQSKTAQGGLTNKQKKEVKAIAASLQGTGPSGPQGATGPQGSPGAKGDPGANGVSGKNGTDGTSVTSSPEGPGVNCSDGGSKFVSASGTEYVCNGQTGFTETLPPNKTETGVYRGWGNTPGFIPVSFNIPLSEAIEEEEIIKVAEGEVAPEECDDGVAPTAGPSHPEADPGFLCIFVQFGATPGAISDPGSGEAPKVGPNGFVMTVISTSQGTWAVTAPEP